MVIVVFWYVCQSESWLLLCCLVSANLVMLTLSLCLLSSSGCQGTLGEVGSLMGALFPFFLVDNPVEAGIVNLLREGIGSLAVLAADAATLFDSLDFGSTIRVGDGGVFRMIKFVPALAAAVVIGIADVAEDDEDDEEEVVAVVVDVAVLGVRVVDSDG